MRDLEELLYFRQFVGGSGQSWLQLGLLLCLFGVLLFQRDRIRFPAFFTCAWLLFALSFIVPHLLTFCLGFLDFINDGSSLRSRSSRGGSSLLMMVQFVSGPILFGLSLIFAFLALSPGTASGGPASPVKHPLE